LIPAGLGGLTGNDPSSCCLKVMPIPNALFAKIMGSISANNVPESAIRVWQTLFHKFAPLLGPLSADLLFARSLAEQRAAFPWLPHIAPEAAGTALAAFELSLSERTMEDIVEANHAMLSTYIRVLTELIGVGLTVNFLGAAFVNEHTNKNS
jgi:hypothetical protein